MNNHGYKNHTSYADYASHHKRNDFTQLGKKCGISADDTVALYQQVQKMQKARCARGRIVVRNDTTATYGTKKSVQNLFTSEITLTSLSLSPTMQSLAKLGCSKSKTRASINCS
jgi:hypothetical protein